MIRKVMPGGVILDTQQNAWHTQEGEKHGATSGSCMTRRLFLAGMGSVAAAVGATMLAGCGSDPSWGTLGVTADGQLAFSDGGTASWGQDGMLRIGMEAGYPPNNWQEDAPSDENIPIENVAGAFANGYDVWIASRIAEGLGLTPTAVKMEFNGLISALNNGQIDIIMAGMAPTEERRQSINFSEFYSPQIEYVVLVMAGSPYASAASLEDFSGATILGQSQTMLDTVIDQIPGVNHATPVDSTSDMLARLENGTVDGITSDYYGALGFVRTNSNLVMVQFDEGKGFELEAAGSSAGIRKADTDLLDQVNAILDQIPQDERRTLMERAVETQPAT